MGRYLSDQRPESPDRSEAADTPFFVFSWSSRPVVSPAIPFGLLPAAASGAHGGGSHDDDRGDGDGPTAAVRRRSSSPGGSARGGWVVSFSDPCAGFDVVMGAMGKWVGVDLPASGDRGSER